MGDRDDMGEGDRLYRGTRGDMEIGVICEYGDRVIVYIMGYVEYADMHDVCNMNKGGYSDMG
eukprot:6448487-Heterocapsa_arctica.AAC.1